MPIVEGIIGSVIFEITKRAGSIAWIKADRNRKVLDILNAVGLKPEKPGTAEDLRFQFLNCS